MQLLGACLLARQSLQHSPEDVINSDPLLGPEPRIGASNALGQAQALLQRCVWY